MDGTGQDRTATDPLREAVVPRAKAVWVTPQLMPADVAGETENGRLRSNFESVPFDVKNGS